MIQFLLKTGIIWTYSIQFWSGHTTGRNVLRAPSWLGLELSSLAARAALLAFLHCTITADGTWRGSDAPGDDGGGEQGGQAAAPDPEAEVPPADPAGRRRDPVRPTQGLPTLR